MTTVLLLHLNGANGSTTFTDSSAAGPHVVVPVGNVQISTAFSKFGNSSAFFDGSGDYLQLDGSLDFAFGNGDYTIDFWIRFTSAPGGKTIYDGRPSGTNAVHPTIYTHSSGALRFFLDGADRITGTTALIAGGWYHVALARFAGNTKLFLNGIQEGSTFADTNIYTISAGRPFIGADSNSEGSFSVAAYIDEFHVVNGAASYVSNFTPPAGPYSPDTLEQRAPFYVYPRGPEQPPRSWTQWYNLNLVGKDRLPTGEQHHELPPRGYPRASPTWTWQYNLNLIGKDQLPVGDQFTDLPPRAPEYPASLRTFIGGKTQEVVVTRPFNQFDWPNPQAPRQPMRSWVWNYNLNLIGQDRLPTGEQHHELPPRGYLPPGHTWLLWRSLATTEIPIGKIIYDLPPRGHLPPGHTWTWSYNLNLIGKDRLPAGEQVFDLPPRGHIYPNQLRTWIDTLKLALITAPPIFPQGKQYTDRPAGAPPRVQTWHWSYNLNLVGKDQLPVGKRHTDLPLAPLQPLRSWTWNYNLNLIGKDQLPSGKQRTELPPQPIYPNDLRTWINRVNLALTTAAAAKPFAQYDWPNPQRARQPDRGFATPMAAVLARPKPFAQYDWPTPKTYQQLDRSFISARNINLFPPPPTPIPGITYPFNQYDWPVVGEWFVPYRDYGFYSLENPNLFVPPPVILPRDPTHARTRSGFEIDDRRGVELDARGAGIDKRATSPNRRGSGQSSRGRNES